MPLYQISRRNEGFLCLIFGVIFFFIGLYSCLDITIFLNGAVSGNGKVVSVTYSEQAKLPYKLIVKLEVPNSQAVNYVFKSKKPYATGDVFELLYNPKNLDDARTVSIPQEYTPGFLLIILGLLLLFMGWVRVKGM